MPRIEAGVNLLLPATRQGDPPWLCARKAVASARSRCWCGSHYRRWLPGRSTPRFAATGEMKKARTGRCYLSLPTGPPRPPRMG
jgi:hypothetical protein